jgi:hypothetical protein
MMRHWPVALCVLAAGLVGCEEVYLLESGDGDTPDPVMQSKGIQGRLSTDGLAALFSSTHPEGLDTTQTPREYRLDGHALTVGPVSQTISIDSLDISTSEGQLDATMTGEEPALTVPVRLDEGASVRVCRFEVSADRFLAHATAVPGPGSARTFELTDDPELLVSDKRIDPAGPCPPLLDNDELPQRVENWLDTYFDVSVRHGVRQYLEIPLIDNLGLPRGSLALRHLSSFDNRQGVLRFDSNPSRDDNAGLDQAGMTLGLDVGLSARRARCMRLESSREPPDDSPAAEVKPGDLADTPADAGFAVAESIVARTLRKATLSGFLCRGLDPRNRPGPHDLRSESPRLEDIGLAHVPASGPFETVVNPGALPEVAFQAERASIRVTWADLTVDLYGRVAGARTRLSSLTASVTFGLRPTETSGSTLDLSIDTLDIHETSLETPWADAPPEGDAVRNWARRLFVLVFEDAFSVPLPFTPGAPLELLDTEIREHDLLIRLRVRPR